MILVAACALALAAAADAPPQMSGPRDGDLLNVRLVGVCRTGGFNESACEIAAWCPRTRRVLVASAAEGLVAVDLKDPSAPSVIQRVALKGVNSVAIHGDLVAVCASPEGASARGLVILLNAELEEVARVAVGHGPDMLTFTPDGKVLLVANEAEPSSDGKIDHEGTVSIIDLSAGAASATVREVTFDAFEQHAESLRARGLHIPMPGRTMAQQLEPEYITTSPDGRWAFVSLQEANAIAIIDVLQAKCVAIEPLGLKDFGAPGVGLDPSDKDGGPSIACWPVHGLYQPDTIACFAHGDDLFIATANEGEPRDYPFYSEVRRISQLVHRDGGERLALDPGRFPAGGRPTSIEGDPATSDAPTAASGANELRSQARLRDPSGAGRLQVSSAAGDLDGDGDYDQLVTFGARSASLWRVRVDEQRNPCGLELAWDSGSEIERTVLARMPGAFNADHRTGKSADSRSDRRGPEPEGLAIAQVGDRRVLIVGLERCGGCIAWDITDPLTPRLATYANRRNASIDLSILSPGDRPSSTSAALDAPASDRQALIEAAGDLGPEGLLTIPSHASPTGQPLLIVCNEVSGTMTVVELSLPASGLRAPSADQAPEDAPAQAGPTRTAP
jgi:2',3'-cyclic-nucleotide 2'-phosphodiesterase/3'-nucleotidase/5'-nucleotidase